jgi:hypothetical protein
MKALKQEGISVQFKYKGNSDVQQGVIFEKNGYSFNGSKVDKMFSYSKIERQLLANVQQSSNQHQQHSFQRDNYSSNPTSGIVESVIGAFGTFDFKSHSDDYEEENFVRKMKKPKKKGRKL